MALAPASAHAQIAASIVVDETSGRILQSSRADMPHPPASLTKMMTLYLVFEALEQGRLKLHQTVPISAHAASRGPTKMYFQAGSQVSVETLILATAIRSANDGAVALAEALAGSESRFAYLMTQKARQLGMTQSVFRTASGLPAYGQVVTARDMAILARAINKRYPQYAHYLTKRSFVYAGRSYSNTHRLMHTNPNVEGMKTGYTRASGFNLATTAKQDGRRVVVVVLGGRSSHTRYMATEQLMAQAFGRRDLAPAPDSAGVAVADRRGLISGAEAAVRRNDSAARAPVAAISTRAVRYERRMAYGVQLGTYRNQAGARSAASAAYRQLPANYRQGVRIAIVQGKQGRAKIYTPRLTVANQMAAANACKVLRGKGHRCSPVAYPVQFAIGAQGVSDTPTETLPPERDADQPPPETPPAKAPEAPRSDWPNAGSDR